MTSEEPISDYLVRAAQGDRVATGRLVQATQDQLYPLALGITGSARLANGALVGAYADAVARAAESAGQDIRHWLVMLVRGHAVRLSEQAGEEVETQRTTPIFRTEQPVEEDLTELLGRLDALPEGQQSLLYLAFFQGRTEREIADYLDAPEPEVRAAAAEALAELSGAAPQENDGDGELAARQLGLLPLEGNLAHLAHLASLREGADLMLAPLAFMLEPMAPQGDVVADVLSSTDEMPARNVHAEGGRRQDAWRAGAILVLATGTAAAVFVGLLSLMNGTTAG